MRTGAPFEKARITPATPTPAPRSAQPEITAWMVSPAPCVPTASIFEIVLLEDAGVLAERRRLVLPVVDLADRDLQRVLRRRRRRASDSANAQIADDSSLFPRSVHRLGFPLSLFALRFDFSRFVRFACRDCALARGATAARRSRRIRTACAAPRARQAAAPSIPRRARAAGGEIDLGPPSRPRPATAARRCRAHARRADTRHLRRIDRAEHELVQRRRRPRSRHGGSSAPANGCRARARARRPPPASPPADWCRRIRRCCPRTAPRGPSSRRDGKPARAARRRSQNGMIAGA